MFSSMNSLLTISRITSFYDLAYWIIVVSLVPSLPLWSLRRFARSSSGERKLAHVLILLRRRFTRSFYSPYPSVCHAVGSFAPTLPSVMP